MSRRQQQQAARALVGRRVVQVKTTRVPGNPHVVATLVFDDGTHAETDHVIDAGFIAREKAQENG